MKKTTMTALTTLASASIAHIANASVPIYAVPEGGDTASLLILGLGLTLFAFSILRRRWQKNT